MSLQKVDLLRDESLQPLTKADIDRRMRWIGNIVTRVDGLEPTTGVDALQPRWITAAELVRRVRPFLSCN